jgi:DNA topoisomerase-1
MLESEGIGRPSTYASIIGTICDRGYAQLTQNTLIPTFTAFAVTALLEEHFPNLVDTSFTSKMEQTLDDISTGSVEWLPYLRKFYSGKAGLETLVKDREQAINPDTARTIALIGLENFKVKIGKYGAYIQVTEGDKQVSATIPQDLTPADLLPEKIEMILKQKLEGPDQLGVHPETGEPIFLLMGQYGAYVQLGEATDEIPKPKRASIAKGTALEQVTLAMAVELLRMPRELGVHPDTGKKIEANLGRFGPYVVHKKGGVEGKDDFRSLKGDDDPYTVSLERAVELLSQPKSVRAGGAKVIRSLGLHPVDQEPIEILAGKYGNYVKHGKVNATLPKGESAEEITLAQAIALLAAKEPAKTKTAAKSTKKTTTKAKATTKSTKSATTKTSTKKSTAKKSAIAATVSS